MSGNSFQKDNEKFFDLYHDALRRKHKDGRVFWVESNYSGSSTYWSGRRIEAALPTIASAIDKCTASRGDVILVPGFHAETVTAAISLSKIGIQLIGLPVGNLYPTITGNGTIDALSIDAADCVVENLAFGAPSTDEQTAMINIAAANAIVKGIRGIGSQTAKNVVDCITLTAAANDCFITDVELWNTVVAVNSFLSFEGAASRVVIKNFFAHGNVATAGVIDAAAVTGLFLEDVRVAVVGTTKPAATLDSNPTGMARNCFFAGTHATLATNANLGNAMRCDNIKVLEETDNSVSAAIIPAVDTD